MLSIIKSIALNGLDGYLVSTQVDISSGLPHFEIVGLPDTAVKESKERIKTAIQNKEPVPEYIPVTEKDIAMLDRDTEITTSEIENAQRITEEIKNQFKGKENEQK